MLKKPVNREGMESEEESCWEKPVQGEWDTNTGVTILQEERLLDHNAWDLRGKNERTSEEEREREQGKEEGIGCEEERVKWVQVWSPHILPSYLHPLH